MSAVLQFPDIEFIEPVNNRKGLKVYLSGSVRAFKLYDTLIMTLNDSYIMLKTDGFRTNHTKNCMNDNLPSGYRVFQKDFEWYVQTPKEVLNFVEEMVIDRSYHAV